ncbi:MAG TPA: hypothetical protein VFC51_18180 [Chloroflexota bacterium]|nr:hypothetical protein [Chloroflexota bacterium]
MAPDLADEIITALRRRDPPAAFASELAATLRQGSVVSQVEEALARLGSDGRIVIQDHAAPDVHLETADLRVVAYVAENGDADPAAAAEKVWSRWVRAFLSTHRCQ